LTGNVLLLQSIVPMLRVMLLLAMLVAMVAAEHQISPAISIAVLPKVQCIAASLALVPLGQQPAQVLQPGAAVAFAPGEARYSQRCLQCD
jgi:hypothetical protein